MTRLPLLLLLTTLLFACAREELPPATPTLTPQQVELEEQIALWEEQEIDDYTMKVNLRHPGWHVQVLQVMVVDGQPQLESHTCFPERSCAVREVDTGRLTVANVVEETLALAANGQIEQIVYHEEYGFPRIVDASDADAWELSNFQVIE